MTAERQNQWPGRYRALLDDNQLDADQVLEASLQTPDLHRPALFSLAQVLENPECLREQILEDYPEVAEQGPIARLSVLQLNLMISVISPLTLQLFRHGTSPLPCPERIFLAALDREQTGQYRWFLAPGEKWADVSTYIRETAEQLEYWYRVFRKPLGVSPGAYWSSAAIALGSPFSAVWNRARAQDVCTLAEAWLGEFDCQAHRYMDWLPAGVGPGQVAIPQRRGCCLNYLLPDGGYCGTCGVHRKERLSALRQGHRQTPTA